MNSEEIVVLFSGGTDSTLAASLMAEEFRKVHLITYNRFGFFSITNPKINVQKLKNKFGDNKFTYRIIGINRLFKFVSNERYLWNLMKHRFFLLSTCGLCKLAMHIRTVIFCLNNQIGNVCDGANQGMHLFPAQMTSIIKETKMMYANFGISYTNPVFDFEGPQDTEFVDRLHLEKIVPNQEKKASYVAKKKRTTGYKLYELGLMPSENVKGTELDRKMQPRCFQFILFNIFVLWYYLHNHTYEEYEKATLRFYKEKIEFFTKLVDEYVKTAKKSRLFKLIED